MAISPVVYEAYKAANPDGSPQEAEAMLNSVKMSMGVSHPGFAPSDDDLIKIFKNQAQPAATPDRAPVEMPRGSATQYDGAPVEQKLGSYTNQAAPVVDPNYQAQAAPVEYPDPKPAYQPKYGMDELAALRKKLESQQSGRRTSEDISNIFAALGGMNSLNTNRNFLASRRAEENNKVEQFKSDSTFADTQQAKATANAKAKEEFEMKKALNDPNSPQSKAAFEAVSAMADNDPRLAERLRNLPPELKTATNLAALGPIYKDTITAAIAMKKNDEASEDRKQTAQWRHEDNLARIQAQKEMAADRLAMMAQLKAMGNNGKAKGEMSDAQASAVVLKASKDVDGAQQAIAGADQSLAGIKKLGESYTDLDKGMGTGPIVGSSTMMGIRSVMPDSGAVQMAQAEEAKLTAAVAKTFGANPSDRETALLDKMSRLSKISKVERDKLLNDVKVAIEEKKKSNVQTLNTLTPLLTKANEALGLEYTLPDLTKPAESGKTVNFGDWK